MVLENIICFDREKGPEPNVEGELVPRMILLESLEQLRSEVEASGGSSSREAVFGIDCLVIILMLKKLLDIGRGGHGTMLGQQGLEIALGDRELKLVLIVTLIGRVGDSGAKIGSEDDYSALFESGASQASVAAVT